MDDERLGRPAKISGSKKKSRKAKGLLGDQKVETPAKDPEVELSRRCREALRLNLPMPRSREPLEIQIRSNLDWVWEQPVEVSRKMIPLKRAVKPDMGTQEAKFTKPEKDIDWGNWGTGPGSFAFQPTRGFDSLLVTYKGTQAHSGARYTRRTRVRSW